jgi:dTDP-4-dehydrorhamnose 3,5-epimerase
MQVFETSISDVKILIMEKHCDSRGVFSETYNQQNLSNAGINIEFVQDNHVLSHLKGTVRALHFQINPFSQDKLVRVVRGAILDVAVDLRNGSPTYGQHVHVTISADEGNQILVPIGFAHGYCTLESETEVLYKTSNFYSPEHERGLLWSDPALDIPWPFGIENLSASRRDNQLPKLNEINDYFCL